MLGSLASVWLTGICHPSAEEGAGQTGGSLELSAQPVYEQDSDLVRKLCPTNRVGSGGIVHLVEFLHLRHEAPGLIPNTV